jgi:nucleoside-diphosphate-sugar epimerase
MEGASAVVHAATLHKPHTRQPPHPRLLDTNITGPWTMLEQSTEAGVRSLVYVCTTSTFGQDRHAGVLDVQSVDRLSGERRSTGEHLGIESGASPVAGRCDP